MSTLEQPWGVTYLLEITNPGALKGDFEKLQKETEAKLKRMFWLNPNRMRNMPIAIILFYSEDKISQAQAGSGVQILRQ